ncbi:MAG: hypothetical protein GWO00_02755, partial [Gemmatimonadetes bacterium]|nr:hypothetical protein [Gemmatimonadota bacterium]NIR77337.1 hypothetical protein [Gemmatimonadota bacterium]NIT85863.1 hypothetical protein [Gemmatimonadota bacterium]NIU29685.1 hypothetical protein [Gemmatimonadota bacterium]NIV60094.1 hypothetical protein [Gemmatimonadota bacterium]
MTAVLDGASLQDPDRLAEAASGLALELGAPTVGFSVYDSDVLTLVLAREDGKTAVVRTEAGVEADPEDVARFADGAAALPETADGVAERLRGLLESPSPGFEEERLAAVDGLLGIDESISGHSVDSLLDALDAGEVSAEVREVRPRAASEAEAELFRAIEKGDDEAVREALQGGADPDARAGGRRAL